MTQALYRKYRPQGWAAVIGQDHVVHTLQNAIKADRVAHAYLFAGPRGTGKTTVARLLAKAVNCLEPDRAGRPCNQCEPCKAANENRLMDMIEIDAASNTGVDDVRDLRDKINFSPTQGQYKIYIVDEVHMLSTAAFNALLKTLEEPPPHAIFILATTEMHKIPATVLSRCQRHEFRRVPVVEIVNNLKQIAAGENIQADDDALTLIARQSAGGMRDAQSLLDQLASTGERITLPLAQTVLGAATSQTVLEVIESIITADPKAGLESLHAALDGGRGGALPGAADRGLPARLDADPDGRCRPGGGHPGGEEADGGPRAGAGLRRGPAPDQIVQRGGHGPAQRVAAIAGSGIGPGGSHGNSARCGSFRPRQSAGRRQACPGQNGCPAETKSGGACQKTGRRTGLPPKSRGKNRSSAQARSSRRGKKSNIPCPRSMPT